MDSRLAPEKPQHGITLFGESAESLPIATRVFARNHPDVTGECLRIDESRRIAKAYFGRQRRHRAHTWMRHEPSGLRTRARLLTDFFIELVDVRRQVIVELL